LIDSSGIHRATRQLQVASRSASLIGPQVAIKWAWGDGGKAHHFVLRCHKVLVVDGFENELLELFAEIVVQLKGGEL